MFPILAKPKPVVITTLVFLFLCLALVLRVTVLNERAFSDPDFSILPEGTDQQTYYEQLLAWERGEWPNAAFKYQPGIVYALIGISAFVGNSLMAIRLAFCVIGAIATGFIWSAGFYLTGNRWGAYWAAGLFAIYPVAILFSTELMLEHIAVVTYTALLALQLKQHQNLSFIRTILIGILLGYLTITRSNMAVLFIPWCYELCWVIVSNWRVRFAHLAVTCLAMMVIIAPITLHNLSYNSPNLISSTGWNEIYRGNNRDTSGVRINSLIAQTIADTDDRYITYLLGDIGRDTARFIELQLHKVGLFWSPNEAGNNLDYREDGEAHSALLRFIPLDFRIVAGVGLFGLIALWRHRPRLAFSFTLTLLGLFGATLLLWVEGRVRLPVIVPLIVLAAYGIITVGSQLKQAGILITLRQHCLPILGLCLFFIACDWAVDRLPRKSTLTQLPVTAVSTNISFEGGLRLRGWRFLEELQSVQYELKPRTPYAIELFWELTEPTDKVYQTGLALVVDNERIAGVDYPIGEVSYPPLPTSQWETGILYREVLGFPVRRNIPIGQKGDIILSVYTLDGEFVYGQPDTRVVTQIAVIAPTPSNVVWIHSVMLTE